MYASYFTSAVTPEVKAERSSDLRAERSSEMGAERSSDSKSGVGWSSDLGVGWNLEQRKCEMGCPLTVFCPCLIVSNLFDTCLCVNEFKNCFCNPSIMDSSDQSLIDL